MPRRLVRHSGHDRVRSLGWFAVWWIENFVLIGRGGAMGQPVRLGDERAGFVVDCYAVSESGGRLYDSAFLSRPKGADKSGLAAALCLLELLAPVRFDRWAVGGESYTFLGKTYVYEPGEPIGKPVHNPFVRILATEEEQSGNTYESVLFNFVDDSAPLHQLVRAYGVNAGKTRIVVPKANGGGEVRPSTSGAASKDGGLETFTVFDEALALDTPLPTPDGWTSMGEICVGDWLIGSAGQPVRVVKVTDVFDDRQCYRVSFRDGSSVVASEGHLWETRLVSSAALPRVRTTGEMFRDGRKFAIPRSAGFVSDDVALPVDPYILGLWLGDGDATNATVTCSVDDLPELVGQVERRGFTARVCADKKGCPRVYVSRPGCVMGRFSKVKSLLTSLRELGVLGNKHIPSLYLRAGTRQRVELLRGLMDSDGYCDKIGHCTFSNSNAVLLDGVRELLRSLGQTVGESFTADSCSRVGGVTRLSFKPRNGLVPFSYARKAARLSGKPMTIRDGWEAITSIEPVESVPVRCVGVDSEDHLFVAGETWRVTHNTHLYNNPKLRSMYETVSRNAVKRRAEGAWFLETTTMYAPGEESVAEQTYELAQQIEEGRARNERLLFDHSWGDPGSLVKSEGESEDEYISRLSEAFREAYGDAIEWNPVEGLLDALFDTRNSETSIRRYFFNAVVAAANAWVSPSEWAGCLVSSVRRRSRVDGVNFRFVPPSVGDEVTLGFDGGRSSDATALVACRVSDRYVFPLLVLECPDSAEADGWQVDREAVDAAVAAAHERFNVVGFFADPALWQDYVDKWSREFGDGYKVFGSAGKPVDWWTNRDTAMVKAVERVETAIRSGALLHGGDRVLSRHVLNARRWERRSGTVIVKERKGSRRKIDAAMAMVLAVEAAAQVSRLRGEVEELKPAYVPFSRSG